MFANKALIQNYINKIVMEHVWLIRLNRERRCNPLWNAAAWTFDSIWRDLMSTDLAE